MGIISCMEVRSKVKKILRQWCHKKTQNDWTNKNVVVFGDSIVAGQELVREETPYRDVVYAKLASYYLNAHKLENFAETGTGQFKGQHHLDQLTGWTHSFEGSIQHYRQEIRRADVILIAYGNNDWKQPNPDGSLHTLDEVKVKLRENIQRIRLINRHVQLVGILETLAFRQHKPAWNLEGPNGFTYQEMLSAFIEVYQEFDVPIFDIRDYHLGNHIDEYVDDRDHFTLAVHRQIAKSLVDFVHYEYQSPAQRFGETIKVIYEEDLFENFKTIKKILEKYLRVSKDDRRIEIMCFMFDLNFKSKLHKLIEMNDFPQNITVTNIYQYYASPLRYGGELDDLSLKMGTLFNQNNMDFIKLDNDKIILKQLDGYEWANSVNREDFNKQWILHYVSLKDDVFIINKGQIKKIEPLKLHELIEKNGR